VALLISSVAVVILLGGFDLFRRWTFPFVLSLFMVPKLAIVYNQGTLPLQLMASRLAAWLLWVTGFGVSRQGNILEIHGRQIFVAEACNGLRYLLPLAFIAMLLGYLSGVKPWARWVLFLASVPVAVLANALRVALVGVAPALGVGALHEATGLLVFAIAVVPLFAVSRFFRRFPAGSHV
jgi:exosortase